MAWKEYLSSLILLLSWDSDEETIDSMPKLVDRAGTIHEWDSDSAYDSDDDINAMMKTVMSAKKRFLICRMRKVPKWLIVASLYRC
jgi:hypothetical protein